MSSKKKYVFLLIPVVAAATYVMIPGTAKEHLSHEVHEELIYDDELPLHEAPTEQFERLTDQDQGSVQSQEGAQSIASSGVAEKISSSSWINYTVKAGDNFSLIGIRELGLSAAEIQQIAKIARESVNVAQLKVGQSFEFKLDDLGSLQALKFTPKADMEFLIQRSESGFQGQKLKKESHLVQQVYSGLVDNSLSSTLKNQGVSGKLAVNAGQLLEKRNNLRRDLRSGDRVDLLVNYDEIDGELYSPSIAAIRLDGSRIHSRLFLHSDGHYYDEEGQGLEPGFNRYPLGTKYRISSPFDLNRKHPVLRKIRPHYGTDFATPVGTTVLSPADGVVTRVTYQRYAGNYVVIEHYNGYVTRYFHLSKSKVKPGQRVVRGQPIALTGNTGRTTGAHLHYELHINGKAVNAMRASLPPSRNLEGKELIAFKAKAAQQLALLEKSEPRIAAAERDNANQT